MELRALRRRAFTCIRSIDHHTARYRHTHYYTRLRRNIPISVSFNTPFDDSLVYAASRGSRARLPPPLQQQPFAFSFFSARYIVASLSREQGAAQAGRFVDAPSI